MVYWLITFVLFLVGAIVFHLLQRKPATPKIKAETRFIDDPLLGQCLIRLPVVGQNQSKGFVEFKHEIDGSECQFHDVFIDESGGTAGMTDTLNRLRKYFAFATNSEKMKIYRNSLAQLTSIHNTFFPDEPLDPVTLKSSAKLYQVTILDTEAWFRFSSKRFMHGRPMCVTVDESGNVTFVGAG